MPTPDAPTADPPAATLVEVPDAGVRFVLPAGFHVLPAVDAATGDPDEDELDAVVTGIVPGADEQQRVAVAATVLRALAVTGDSVVRPHLTALGVLDDDEGGVAHLHLVVLSRPSRDTGEAALDGLVEVLSRGRADVPGPVDVRRVELPCGPAVVDTRVEGVQRAGGAGPVLSTGRFDVHVPSPAGRVVVLSLGTSALHVWASVSALAAAVAASVSFTTR